MLVFEAKLEGTKQQHQSLDEVIRTARFVRNACLRYWMDNRDIGRYDLRKLLLYKSSRRKRKLNSVTD